MTNSLIFLRSQCLIVGNDKRNYTSATIVDKNFLAKYVQYYNWLVNQLLSINRSCMNINLTSNYDNIIP